ncbi:hypothetical protein ACX9MO_05490 [Pseudooceanicola sp. 502str34]
MAFKAFPPKAPRRHPAAVALALTTALVGLSSPAVAQEETYLPQAQKNFEEVNNGTNPTLLTTQAGIQYQFNRVTSDLDFGMTELLYTQPFGGGDKAFRFTLPFGNSVFDSDLDLGDISLTYIDVMHVNAKTGSAYTVELFLDTAGRDDLGYGQFAMETSVFYAWFLKGGSIFAPAWVQTFGLEGGNDAGGKLNTTTVDFYYVPKLPNPKYFMTVDPAVVHDWEADKTFGSLSVTMGMMTGKAFGGDSQVFIKPGVLIGGDRPADWSVQVGYKVLNF